MAAITDELTVPAPDLGEELALDERIEVPPAPPPGLDTALYDHDDPVARRELRDQIARLEGSLARVLGAAFPRQGIDFRPGAAVAGGPRVLTLGELERTRDALAARLRTATRELDEATSLEADFRGLIEEMTSDPAAHKWERVSNEDIGEPGCRHWHSKPRWGLLGMLLGWWRVKVSSGCPLAEGRGSAATPTPSPPS